MEQAKTEIAAVKAEYASKSLAHIVVASTSVAPSALDDVANQPVRVLEAVLAGLGYADS